MSNPFEVLENRLLKIENLIYSLKNEPEKTEVESHERPIGVKEAAEFLALRPATIYTKASNGEIPHVKRGGKLYFFRSVLSEYLQGK